MDLNAVEGTQVKQKKNLLTERGFLLKMILKTQTRALLFEGLETE